MKTESGFAMLLIAGAMLFPATATLANVQPAPQFQAAPAVTALAKFQIAAAKKAACPEGTRWSEGAKICVKKR